LALHRYAAWDLTDCLDPDDAGKVFVGSADGYGVFESVDAGLSFIPINGNLGNLYVNCLKFLANGKLLAGTADGVYKYDFNAGIDDKPQRCRIILRFCKITPTL
jgi:outer membrane protein assembly factor BamB